MDDPSPDSARARPDKAPEDLPTTPIELPGDPLADPQGVIGAGAPLPVGKEVELHRRFVANLTHEVRAPATSIIGLCNLLRETGLRDEQQRLVADIDRSARVLLDVVKVALEFSAVESGSVTLRLDTFSIDEMLQDVRVLYAGQAAAKQIDLTVRRSEEVPDCRLGDVRSLRQILLNLVGNAVKFTETGWVRLDVVRGNAPTDVVFEVRDTGPGIAPHNLDRVFEPFLQLGDRKRRRGEGAGLGLALTRALVHRLDGRIDLSSTPGEGTCFRVLLPLIVQKREADARPQAGLPTRLTGRVLIVDDDSIGRIVTRSMLRRLGVTTREAANGREALDAAAEEPPDALLVDLHLPDMGGVELVHRLRGTPSGAHLPVIALTASDSDVDRAAAAAAGIVEFLTKPVTRHHLAQALHPYLGTSKGPDEGRQGDGDCSQKDVHR